MKIYIYALINPITNLVFYIGSSYNPKIRLSNHLSQKEQTSFKAKEIYLIKNRGLKPELLVLDECTEKSASFWEEFYLDLYKSYGFDLKQRCISGYSESFSGKGIGTNRVTSKCLDMNENLFKCIQLICKHNGIRQKDFITTALISHTKRYIQKGEMTFEEMKGELFRQFGIPSE